MIDQSEFAKAEDEAANWAVLLADDPENAEQLERFDVWLHTSPLHAEVWRRTQHAHAALGQLHPATQVRWPQAVILCGRPKNRKKSVAGLAAVTCLAMVWFSAFTLRLSADYISGTGEQQTHVLGDGSRLFLAPQSAVDIAFTDAERHVRLLEGNVFFEVSPNADRPFSVDAGDIRTTVLGTAFNVSKTDGGAVVSVAHGRVHVEDQSLEPSVSKSLIAGDRLTVTRGRNVSFSRVAPDEVAHWRKGELIARDLRIKDVVEALRPYYSGVIVVTEPFAQQRVTGLYRLNDPVKTLTAMAAAHDATVRRITPWLLVLSQ